MSRKGGTTTPDNDHGFVRWKWFDWTFVLLLTAFFNISFEYGLLGAALAGIACALIYHFTIHQIFLQLFPQLYRPKENSSKDIN